MTHHIIPSQLYRKEPDMKPTYDPDILSTVVKRHRARLLWGVSAVAVAAVLWAAVAWAMTA